jgi:hypothetical protein
VRVPRGGDEHSAPRGFELLSARDPVRSRCFIRSGELADRIPDGVGDIERHGVGFTGSVSLPVEEDGFFGRSCPECESPFKTQADGCTAFPEETELHCLTAGHATSRVSS